VKELIESINLVKSPVEFLAALFTIASIMIASIFNILKKYRKDPARKEKTTDFCEQKLEITPSENSSVNINGSVIQQNITNTSNRIPETLAIPDFRIKQVGCTMLGGEHPEQEYWFELMNLGGDCLSVKVLVRQETIREFAKFPRDERKNINIKFTSSPFNLDILISGFDGNGTQYKKNFCGTRMKEGYEFQCVG